MSWSIISEKVVPTYHTVVTDGSWLLEGRCRRQDCQKGKDGGSWCLHFCYRICFIDAGVKQTCETLLQLSVNVSLMLMEFHQGFFRCESEKNFSLEPIAMTKTKNSKRFTMMFLWSGWCHLEIAELRGGRDAVGASYVRNWLRQGIPRWMAASGITWIFHFSSGICADAKTYVQQTDESWSCLSRIYT